MNSREPHRPPAFPRRVAVAAVLAAATVAIAFQNGCASAPAEVSTVRPDFPSPDSGPGRPALDRSAKRQIDKGWQAILRSDTSSAKARAAEAGANDASELLGLQAELLAGGSTVQALGELTDEAPGYAAAWLTLSVAAERAGDEARALEAAAKGANLWPEDRWIERSETLRKRWIGDRIDTASTLLAKGDPKGSLAALAPALQLDPGNQGAVLLQARSLIALDELDRAEAVLANLPRDRDVVLLSGSIAEHRGDTAAAIRIYSSLGNDPEALLRAIAIAENQDDWQTAMNLYASLPDDRPEKSSGLREAKLRWRVSVMPAYVQEALSSEAATRSDLAVIIVTLAPTVETLPSKKVPLLSDIVDMPSQREIITATSLGLIDVDPLEHTFEPHRLVTANEVRFAITTLGRLLEVPTPAFCGENAAEPCVALTAPISGDQIVDVMIEMLAGETS